MLAENFWNIHGLLFLLGLVFFPRLTVWIFSAVTGGFFFWLGFLFFPRIFIAVIAAVNYWDANPVLVIIACWLCLCGEFAEKQTAIGYSSPRND